ncbi:galactosylgalactosylxylosylprotein 3-beta-glucuronosyltransferase P [Asbolus verrucosus]|uniref:Galactosylgalactosylxylosylprotein 3-beta-glucuronosyltransferase n=1 Tax=Asbolus verrucosus TaxID=1661398 RepID=A0A482W170_ASBVE|nr:galactosylgalactosylxylosylprotein 3-beta-glucuronosyltransferase P [Asbolus verrucosus]
MYLIIFVSASVILYQYHLSNAWLISQTGTQDFRVLNVKSKEKRNNITSIFNASSISNASSSLYPNTSVLCLQPQTNENGLPPLYIITPTYRRPEQLAELTRLSHTLMLVKNVYWIVVEDATKKTVLVTDLLKKTRLKYEHLIAPMPEQYKKKKKGPKPRGVSNRNRGLQWIRENAKSGVFYFADDDNTYDLQLFDEIRYTKKVSMFPVGLITKLGVSSPIVKNGVFSGFYDGWMAGRKFPVDMAGFAVSVKFLLNRPKALMPFKPGFEEDGFLKSLEPFEPQDIELLASNCTKILVWHTQTKKNEPSQPLDFAKYNNTNLVMLKQILV